MMQKQKYGEGTGCGRTIWMIILEKIYKLEKRNIEKLTKQ